MRVLIIDDAELDSMLCKKLVTNLGHDAITTSNAHQALEIMTSTNYPSMIIVDWMMPKMNGLEFIEIIRDMEILIKPFILVMTSNDEVHAEATALNAGADDFIHKPLDIIDLHAKLNLGQRLIKTQLELLVANQKLDQLARHDDASGALSFKSGMARLTRELSQLHQQSTHDALVLRYKVQFKLPLQESFRVDLKNDLSRQFVMFLQEVNANLAIIIKLGDDDYLIFLQHKPELHQSKVDKTFGALKHHINNLNRMNLSPLISFGSLALRPGQCLITADELLYEVAMKMKTVEINAATNHAWSYLCNTHKNPSEVLDFVDFKKKYHK